MTARILVVEDKAALRAMVERLIGPEAQAGRVVDGAGDAASGLALMRQHDYDVVLSDVRLPDGDGFAVLAAVKAESPDTEVILMTAFAQVDAAVAAVKAGAFDYLPKPFEPDDLLLKVARALERCARSVLRVSAV